MGAEGRSTLTVFFFLQSTKSAACRSQNGWGGNADPLAVIQRQLEIYNKRDVEEFMTLFADDCALIDLQTGVELARGKDSIRERYTRRFAAPGLKCTLHARMAIGRSCRPVHRPRFCPKSSLTPFKQSCRGQGVHNRPSRGKRSELFGSVSSERPGPHLPGNMSCGTMPRALTAYRLQ